MSLVIGLFHDSLAARHESIEVLIVSGHDSYCKEAVDMDASKQTR